MPSIGLPELILLGPFLVIGFLAYWLPLLAAFRLGSTNKFAVFLVTLLSGWTMVGWLVAMIMAVRGENASAEAERRVPPIR